MSAIRWDLRRGGFVAAPSVEDKPLSDVTLSPGWLKRGLDHEAHPRRFAECQYLRWSSRTCERGMDGCTVVHGWPSCTIDPLSSRMCCLGTKSCTATHEHMRFGMVRDWPMPRVWPRRCSCVLGWDPENCRRCRWLEDWAFTTATAIAAIQSGRWRHVRRLA